MQSLRTAMTEIFSFREFQNLFFNVACTGGTCRWLEAKMLAEVMLYKARRCVMIN